MITNLIKEVYVLYNTELEEYFDETGYTDPSPHNAMWWKSKEHAEKVKSTLDFPEQFTIKKMKITLEILD